MLTRRDALQLAASAVAMPYVSTAGSAQAYPSRSITLIVPFAPGAGTDVSARIVGEHMSRTLGQPIVIENVMVPVVRQVRRGRCAPVPTATQS